MNATLDDDDRARLLDAAIDRLEKALEQTREAPTWMFVLAMIGLVALGVICIPILTYITLALARVMALCCPDRRPLLLGRDLETSNTPRALSSTRRSSARRVPQEVRQAIMERETAEDLGSNKSGRDRAIEDRALDMDL